MDKIRTREVVDGQDANPESSYGRNANPLRRRWPEREPAVPLTAEIRTRYVADSRGARLASS